MGEMLSCKLTMREGQCIDLGICVKTVKSATPEVECFRKCPLSTLLLPVTDLEAQTSSQMLTDERDFHNPAALNYDQREMT